jgi:hypothetical protein
MTRSKITDKKSPPLAVEQNLPEDSFILECGPAFFGWVEHGIQSNGKDEDGIWFSKPPSKWTFLKNGSYLVKWMSQKEIMGWNKQNELDNVLRAEKNQVRFASNGCPI